MAEAKLRGEAVPAEGYAAVMAGLIGQPRGEDMDIVVLACTHFPLVEEELAAAARRPMRFVHGGHGIARRVTHLLRDADWTGCAPTGLAVFTARDEKSAALVPALTARGLDVDYL
jgi:glutamate racemase